MAGYVVTSAGLMGPKGVVKPKGVIGVPSVFGGQPYKPPPKPQTFYGGSYKTKAQATAISRALEQYLPGGGYGKGVEAGLERGRVKAVAGGMQSLVSAGLAGTTMAAGLGKRYEEEVAMPARARVEETRAQAISAIRMAEAGMETQAVEAARTRALQTYLAQLQASTSMQLGAMRQPSLVSAGASTPAPTPTRTEPAYEFPRAPSLVSADRGRAEPEFGPTEFGQYGEFYGAAYKKPEGYTPEYWLGGPMGR